MKIILTKTHFERGVHRDPKNCAVAIAINEACPTHEAEVWAGVAEIALYPLLGGEVIRIPTDFDTDVWNAVLAFECGSWRMDDGDRVLEVAIPELTTSRKESEADSVSAPTNSVIASVTQ